MADQLSNLSRAVAALRVAVHAACQRDREAHRALLGLGDALDRVMLALPSPADELDCRALGVSAARMADAHGELRRAWSAASGPAVGLFNDRVLQVAVALAELVHRAEAAFHDELQAQLQPLPAQHGDAGAALPASPPPMPSTIRLGVCAPRSARAGGQFFARFVAYADGDAAAVLALLAGPAAARRGAAGSAQAEVSLQALGLQVEGGEAHAQALAWSGAPVLLDFRVDVPAGWSLPSTVLKFRLTVGGLVLAQIDLDIVFEGDTSPRHSLGHQPLHSLFASYAASDRARVLDRLAVLRAAIGIDVFLDCRDLNAAMRWQPRLEHEILVREGFVLFWSKAAADSSCVAWELERALDRKELDHMQVQLLDAGLRPPRALTGAYVGDSPPAPRP